MEHVKQTCVKLLDDAEHIIRNVLRYSRHNDRPINRADGLEALALLKALKEGRYKFESEAWLNIGQKNVALPAEMLLRAYNPAGEKIAPYKPISFINDNRVHAPFDQAIILLSVAQALEQGAPYISINTSARNISDQKFWLDTRALLKHHFKDDLDKVMLVFEITEDALASHPCRDVLIKMKQEMKCAFAIDDSYHDSADIRRLLNLAARRGYYEQDAEGHGKRTLETGIISFVKIDGSVIRKAFDDIDSGVDEKTVSFNLRKITDKTRELFPGDVLIIAERVRTRKEITFLEKETDIDAIQGHMLTLVPPSPKPAIANTGKPPQPCS